jgi:ketosteroid isomerase-like protein
MSPRPPTRWSLRAPFTRRWIATGTSIPSRASSRLTRVWDLSESHPRIYEGVAAIRDFLVGYWATWEDHHHEIEEILDLSNGVLSVAIREDGCPRGSNARVQSSHLQVFEWGQGEIVRITGYPDIDAARAAAERLAEQGG